MKIRSKLFVVTLTILLIQPLLRAQTPCLSGNCYTRINATDTIICQGETVVLTVDTGSALLFNDFNGQTLGAGWSVNPGTVVNYNNPCGPGLDGTPHVWFGNGAPQGTRFLSTVDFNTTAGGFLQFDFKMATQGQASPCEGPDEIDEGVSLQYSNDYGATWIDIAYFSPNGTIMPANPCPNCSNGAYVATSPFLSWATYTFPFPAGAQTLCTRFRWTQPYNTSATNDHWGIDNVLIYANIPPIPGFVNTATWMDTNQPITGPRTVTPNVTTSYIARYETGGGTCYDTLTVVVNPKPNADLSGPNNVCVGQLNLFSAAGTTIASGSITNYVFKLNPSGATNYSGPNNALNYSFPVSVPTFNASVIVTSNAGCKDTALMSLTISPGATPSFTMPDTVCVGQTVTLDASASTIAAPGIMGAYVWDYNNDGVSDDSLFTNTSSFVATTSGLQTVKLSLYNTVGCSVTVTKNIRVLDQPIADFEVIPACIDAASEFINNQLTANIDYIYDFGDGSAIQPNNNANFTHIYGHGIYTVTMLASQHNICFDTATVTIDISNDIVADFNFNEPCNLNGVFSDLSSIPAGSAGTIDSWNWSFGDGNNSTDQNPSNAYTQSNDYTVTLIVSSSEGCWDTIQKTVPKYASPIADFTFSEVCFESLTKLANSSTIAAGTIAISNWDLGDGTQISNPDVDYSYDAPGAYNVTLIVESDKGCRDTVSKTVNVWPVPTAGFLTTPPGQTTMLEPLVEITDQSTGASVYEYFIPNQGTYNTPSPSVEFSNSGNYTIFQTITNEYGCEDRAQMEYIVMSAYTFYVPNSFTPNEGDIINPVFKVYSNGLETIDFRVFNRWGEEIFTSMDPKFIWDGYYKGKLLPADVYVYRCITRDVEGNEYIYSGQINLVR